MRKLFVFVSVILMMIMIADDGDGQEIRLIDDCVDDFKLVQNRQSRAVAMDNDLLSKEQINELFRRVASELDHQASTKLKLRKRALNEKNNSTESVGVASIGDKKSNESLSGDGSHQSKLALSIGSNKASHVTNKLANVALRVSKLILESKKAGNSHKSLGPNIMPYGNSTATNNYQNNNRNNDNYDNSNNNNYDSYLNQYQAPKEFCPNVEKIFCDFAYPYRTLDGSCNNRLNTWWGKRETPFKRLLYPVYDDGVDVPRIKSVTGNRLRNPRSIALEVHTPIDRTIQATNMLIHFGQFMDHDLSLTALISDEDGNPIKCFCNDEDTDCINIQTPSYDPFNKDQRCMVTPRSSASFKSFDCNLGAREQLNLLTHWLDLSQTYGNDLDKNLRLRTMYGGQLRTSKIKGIHRDYLPFNKEGRCFARRGKICFETGDPRSNQNLLLISLQTVWLREHNRVAKQLAELNPYWDDEKLFQEARRITIAEYQHIIYKDWLPILLGDYVINLYNLKPLNQDFLFKYNQNIYPNIANEFATAAFRFGHSMIRSFVRKRDTDYSFMRNISINNIIMNSFHAFKRGGLDSLVRGACVDKSYAFDVHVTNQMTNYLFEEKIPDIPTHRFSLPALNINRGRDHGLQSYNFYRELCGLNRAFAFNDLYNIPLKLRRRLADVYEHVDDIDLFTGGTAELPIKGGLIGPTFACIIAKQFRDLKFGDRFYYENGDDSDPVNSNGGGGGGGFTIEQLDQIRNANIARILCDNVDMEFIQRNPFMSTDHELNPLIDCSKLPFISLQEWKASTY